MEAQAHIFELKRKHRNLDELIEAEIAHPGTDDLAIRDLKRKKLRLKEEIARLGNVAH